MAQIIAGIGCDNGDQVPHPQHENPQSVSPLFLYNCEHQYRSQQLNPLSRHSHIQHDQYHHHHHHHQYESLASLLVQQSSFDIEGDYENHDNHDDEKSWNKNSDNSDSIASNYSTTIMNDGHECRKSCSSLALPSLSDSPRDIMVGMVGIVTMGIILGLIFPYSSSSPSLENSKWITLSNILGYTYFVSWTCSFYPQIITNWYAPTEANNGVSLDFCVWNIVGFICYAIYTTCFRFSGVVRMEYAHRFGGGEHGNITNSTTPTYYDDKDTTTINNEDVVVVPLVQTNDVAFAWHALLLATITFVQLTWLSGDGVCGAGSSVCGVEHHTIRPRGDDDGWLHEHVEVEKESEMIMDDRGHIIQNTRPTGPSIDSTHQKDTVRDWRRRISSTTKFMILLLIMVCIAGATIVACQTPFGVGEEWTQWQWIDFLYFLSFVKVGISIVKYIPQVRQHQPI